MADKAISVNPGDTPLILAIVSNACGSSIAGGVAVLGGIGALIGARSQGSRAVPVYRAASRTLTVSPTIGPRSMGAVVAAHF